MKNILINRNNYLVLILLFLYPFQSCKKLVEVNAPITSINGGNIYDDNSSAASVLTGIYAKMSASSITTASLRAIPFFTGLSSDELILVNQTSLSNLAYYTNQLTPTSGQDFWVQIYPVIFTANSAIEGLNNSSKLTPSVKNQLLGEAKFMRAFCYFYLTNLYGAVPLVTTTDYKINSDIPRSSVSDVYRQIINDLIDAESLMNPSYLNGDALTVSNERVRPNKFAAAALLARAYLYNKDFKNAELEASKVIDNGTYSLMPLNSVFLNGSKEAIWQLYNVGTGVASNTPDGRLYILPSAGPGGNYPVYLSNNLVNSFDSGDQRKSNWLNSITVLGQTFFYPYKYKIGSTNSAPTEYSMVLRLAEMYLIRAEARIQLDNVTGGLNDLNILRTRATDLNAPIGSRLAQISLTLSKSDALLAVEHERQVELFAEWGDRWLNLKRTERANAVLEPIKGVKWQPTDQLYPISQSEIDKNPGLKSQQNPGY